MRCIGSRVFPRRYRKLQSQKLAQKNLEAKTKTFTYDASADSIKVKTIVHKHCATGCKFLENGFLKVFDTSHSKKWNASSIYTLRYYENLHNFLNLLIKGRTRFHNIARENELNVCPGIFQVSFISCLP